MNELKEAWNNIDAPRFDTRISTELLHNKSKGVIEKINYKLKVKLWFVMGGILFFSTCLIVAPSLIAQLLLLILIAVYAISGSLLYRERQKLIDRNVEIKDLSATINEYYTKVKNVLRTEEIVGLALYPIALAAGMMIGFSQGTSEREFFTERNDWIALGVAFVIFVPISHLLTRFMNNAAFGKYLKELENNIIELKEDK